MERAVGAGELAICPSRHADGQEEHHRTKTFQDEFPTFLRHYEIEFDERYVWD
jgi:hypothetical protein